MCVCVFIYIYIYVYVCMCVCPCLCVCVRALLILFSRRILNTDIRSSGQLHNAASNARALPGSDEHIAGDAALKSSDRRKSLHRLEEFLS